MNSFKTSLLLLTSFFLSYTAAQNRLTIKISGVRNDNGVILLELFDSSHTTLLREKGFIQKNKSTIIIENLKPSKYAVRYFHDENSNNKHEKNMLGMPTEGYGFSNNAYGKFGPDPFGKWIFEVRDDTTILMITKN